MSSPQTTSWLLLSNQAHQWPPFWSLAWRVIQMSLRFAVKLGIIVLSLSGLVSISPISSGPSHEKCDNPGETSMVEIKPGQRYKAPFPCQMNQCGHVSTYYRTFCTHPHAILNNTD
ncbi:hypothetical protein B0T12DRAFT_423775 [Alternaria alternata]|jgi:hypothetical protein|nr:hypothetical protein B0T12DRAFT_423775 [Alternaria alternata]